MAMNIDCPLFQAQTNTCKDINARLGWPHGIQKSVCVDCQKCGSPSHPDAVKVRDAQVDRMVAFMRQKENLLKAQAPVMRAMMENHLTDAEREAFVSDPEFPFALTRKSRWDSVKHTWDMASSFIMSAASRGVAGKKVELTVKGERQVSCFGTDELAPCPSLRKSEKNGRHFCNDCGCGEQNLAYLDGDPDIYVKLDYPYLECPRARKGFSNYKQNRD